MIHFELIFVYGMKYVSKVTFLHMDLLLFHHHCWKDYPVLLAHLLKIDWPGYKGLFLKLVFCCIDLYVCPYAITNYIVSIDVAL